MSCASAGTSPSSCPLDMEYLDQLGLTEQIPAWRELLAETAQGETAQ